MQVELIRTTNKNFDYLVGNTGELDIRLKAFFGYDEGTLVTSKIKKIVYEKLKDGTEITVHTKNSLYVFEA